MKGNKTQWYIGTPNGVVLSVDERHDTDIKGHYYHAYKREGTALHNLEQMVFDLEKFFDTINFPHATTNNRFFTEKASVPTKKQEINKVMTDEELLSKHGDLGSFIIRVHHRQNSSWQGRVTWMEEDKTVSFRSIFELIKLIDSALDTVENPGETDGKKNWEEE